MMNFDDIPISKIQKMPGYQTGLGMQDGTAQGDVYAHPDEQPNGAAPGGNLEDEEAAAKPLAERVMNPKWSIRLAAYKEIHNLFYSDYAQYQASKSSNDANDLMASFD